MMVNFPFSKELKIIFDLVDQDGSLRVVGGSVRDFLIGRDISDIDLACIYAPQKTISLLSKNPNIKVIPTGIKHGTITAIINNIPFEITTLRKDVQTDGRRAQVEFVDDFMQDAKRRDFTINAMSIDINGNLFDYFDGLKDLKSNKVRFIGDAKQRIEEDYLRILRFFRFSCHYSKEIDQLAIKEIIKLKKELKNLSSHRVRSELIKIIQCNDYDNLLKILRQMQDKEILQEILLVKNLDLSFLKNLFDFSNHISHQQNFIIRFCSLIYSRTEGLNKIIDHLQFSNKEKKLIANILSLSRNISLDISNIDLLKLLFDFDKNLVIDALKINIISSSKIDKDSVNKFLELQDHINSLKLPNFEINGNDLIKVKIDPKNIGATLKKLRNFWIDSEFNLSKEELIEIASQSHFKI